MLLHVVVIEVPVKEGFSVLLQTTEQTLFNLMQQIETNK